MGEKIEAAGGFAAPAPDLYHLAMRNPWEAIREEKIERLRTVLAENLPMVYPELTGEILGLIADDYDPTPSSFLDLVPPLTADRGGIRYWTPPEDFGKPPRLPTRLYRRAAGKIRRWWYTRRPVVRARAFRDRVRDTRDVWRGRKVAADEDALYDY